MYSYGDDDLNRTEGPEEKESVDEDSRESNSVSISLQKSLWEIGFFPFDCCCRCSKSLLLQKAVSWGMVFHMCFLLTIERNFVVLCLLRCTNRAIKHVCA